MTAGVRRFGWAGITLIVVILALLGWQWVSSAPNGARSIRLTIPGKTGSYEIGQLLERSGAIRSAWAWQAYVCVRGWRADLKAGTYQFVPDSLGEVAAQIYRGDVLKVRYTIPEGWDLTQMARYFEQQGHFSAQTFLTLTRGSAMLRPDWLPPATDRLEGFLFPDTYELSFDRFNARAVVNQMLGGFRAQALPLYQSAPAPRPALLEWVTLASLVEKEAAVPLERPTIAGVFQARLLRKMSLASDPTVEYALGIRQSADVPLNLAQVRTPSPYNTYLNVGLPPTPIASPGLASLRASLKPVASEYLFFVARYDGTHVFSRTASEHEQAKMEIRARRKMQARQLIDSKQ